MSGNPVSGSLYVYAPNEGAAIFFAVAFAISAVGHIWQCWRTRSLKLLGLYPFCATLFAMAYALRSYNAAGHYVYAGNNPSLANLLVFILSQVFIYVCPPALELANYHILGRIMEYVPSNAPVRPDLVLRVFAPLLLATEGINGAGISLAANPAASPSSQKAGGDLNLVALCLQLVAIVVFLSLAAIFHVRCRKTGLLPYAVKTLLCVLYASMTLILVRNIYRLVEHTQDTTVDLNDPDSLLRLAPELRYEWYFYVFDATMMLINTAIWNVYHPTRFLPLDKREYLSTDGTVRIADPVVERVRWWQAFYSPIAAYNMIRGAKQHGQRLTDDHEMNGAGSMSHDRAAK